jgi:hypothetical protein
LVQDLQPVVAHPDRIQVRESQAEPASHAVGVLADHIPFTTLNPFLAIDGSATNLLELLYDTLIRIDLNELSESQLSEIERGFDVYVSGSKLRILTTTLDRENNENIELVPEKAKAGYTQGFADPEFIKELSVFHLPFLSKERKYRTFQVSGDSMFPIPEGSWITGEFVQDWNTLKDHQAYIILTLDEGIVFKLIENKIKPDKKLKLFSLNPFYEPYELPVNEIKEVWKFVNYISSELPEPKLPKEDLITTVANLKHDMDKIKLKFSVD